MIQLHPRIRNLPRPGRAGDHTASDVAGMGAGLACGFIRIPRVLRQLLDVAPP